MDTKHVFLKIKQTVHFPVRWAWFFYSVICSCATPSLALLHLQLAVEVNVAWETWFWLGGRISHSSQRTNMQTRCFHANIPWQTTQGERHPEDTSCAGRIQAVLFWNCPRGSSKPLKDPSDHRCEFCGDSHVVYFTKWPLFFLYRILLTMGAPREGCDYIYEVSKNGVVAVLGATLQQLAGDKTWPLLWSTR